MNFQDIIVEVLEHEGGYVNDPDDLGGETNFGITKRWYPDLDIKNLTKQEAINIYYTDYWVPSKAGDLSSEIQSTYFDMCVNMGQTNAVLTLQEAINSVKMTKIAEDGIIGKETIGNAHRIKKRRLQAFRCLYYSKVVLGNPTQYKFYYGWYKRATKV